MVLAVNPRSNTMIHSSAAAVLMVRFVAEYPVDERHGIEVRGSQPHHSSHASPQVENLGLKRRSLFEAGQAVDRAGGLALTRDEVRKTRRRGASPKRRQRSGDWMPRARTRAGGTEVRIDPHTAGRRSSHPRMARRLRCFAAHRGRLLEWCIAHEFRSSCGQVFGCNKLGGTSAGGDRAGGQPETNWRN